MTAPQNDFTARLGVAHPIVQAPMAGGITTAAVCEAGALGSIAGAYLGAARIAEVAAAVRARTARPFGINIFAPTAAPGAVDPEQTARALARVARFHTELGLPPPTLPAWSGETFEEDFAAALESGATVLSFTFGLLPPAAMRAAKDRGMTVLGTATTVDEAIALEAAGVDAVIAQGAEAGGHRGTFLSRTNDGTVRFGDALIGTLALVPQVVDAVRVPVIAAGGIMDGRGIAAALALGASAAQLGTAFLMCDESGALPAHKDRVLAAHEDQTRVTRAFSGRPARGLGNRYADAVDAPDDASAAAAAAAPMSTTASSSGEPGAGIMPARRDAILPFPLQTALARPLRAAAIEAGRGADDIVPLFAGQGVRLARRLSAADLVARLVHETAHAIRQLTADQRQHDAPM